MRELHRIIHKLTPSQRLNKAARHLLDALYDREVRNDLDGTTCVQPTAYSLQKTARNS